MFRHYFLSVCLLLCSSFSGLQVLLTNQELIPGDLQFLDRIFSSPRCSFKEVGVQENQFEFQPDHLVVFLRMTITGSHLFLRMTFTGSHFNWMMKRLYIMHQSTIGISMIYVNTVAESPETLAQGSCYHDEEHRSWNFIEWNIGVSKKRGTPKWMVYNRKPY